MTLEETERYRNGRTAETRLSPVPVQKMIFKTVRRGSGRT
jgi:hypothetical protein